MQVEFYFVPQLCLTSQHLAFTHAFVNEHFLHQSLFLIQIVLVPISHPFSILHYMQYTQSPFAASLSESACCFLFLDSFEECKSYFFVICGDSSDVVFVVRMGFWVQEERPWGPSGILITSYQKAYSITIVYDCWPWC